MEAETRKDTDILRIKKMFPALPLMFISYFDERYYGSRFLASSKPGAKPDRSLTKATCIEHFMTRGLEKGLPFREGFHFDRAFYATTYLHRPDMPLEEAYRHYVTVGMISDRFPNAKRYIENRLGHSLAFASAEVALPLAPVDPAVERFPERLDAMINLIGDESVQIEIDDASAAFVLAVALYHRNRNEWPKAFIAIQKLLRCVPDYEPAYPHYAELLEKTGVYPVSRAYYDRALATADETKRGYYSLKIRHCDHMMAAG
ncbi:hypothetical protein [Jiella mangrovi]|uniref:Tetratricopeptide repeat protein n=1 Tax=Jiella mangrovi TaxID=2821407 RepID=A0ABS4BKZ5_9HYPH|nr:hypothetical protein [Jiella mangrovi]MBP0617393.1 hypothetical protein [Jiella mangrovi]